MAHGGCEAGRGNAALQYVRVLASPARGLPHWLTLQGNKAGGKRDPRMGLGVNASLSWTGGWRRTGGTV